ncbi:MAG TPA: flagellar hook capping FlgD N-terminal domain-containing protein [Polyangiaceae bacterium]|nr:flagellar hook capping FlgD N-terminal domain-containing protein [Polyangiaceae bacterium]
MVDPVKSGLGAGALSEALNAGGSKPLGQEAFLKLLVAQLQNQDPLNPQENYEFVAQLAQFSSLEQSIGINDRLDALALQNQGLQNSQIVGLVGKEATVKGDIVTLSGQGAIVPISYTLDDAAEESTIVIRDAAGRTVRTIPVAAKAEGTVTVSWNGQSDAGKPMPAGPYKVTVTAKDADGKPVALTQQSKGQIEAVSFDRGFPVLHLDSGVAAPVGDLISVSPSTSPNP